MIEIPRDEQNCEAKLKISQASSGDRQISGLARERSALSIRLREAIGCKQNSSNRGKEMEVRKRPI